MDKKLQGYIDKLNKLNFKEMYNGDFFLTWEKTDDELEAVFTVAEALRYMRENNISTKVFESGLGISLFRDNSTRTRFSFASACNLLGLEVQDLDETKSQIAHGETVRETANMISFMADVIGIRDDMYIGKGNKYMHEVVDSVTQGNKDGVLEQKPTLVNLQCDIDHPTQCMADMLHIINTFGGVENLKGKKVAMTWAYSPSYGKPLSVPQGVVGLMTRFGMDVVLAHPEGYDIMPEVEEVDAGLDMNDVRIDITRSSGCGGQGVNTTDSAVRLTHLPTGIIVYSQTERSQIKNKEKAFKILQARLYDLKLQERDKEVGAERRSKIGTGDRSEKIRTYNYPQNRVTDHRIGFTVNTLDKVMQGDIEKIIEALITEDQKRKLAEQ